MTTRVFLVRHGETEWNAQRRIQGHTDVSLNEQGRQQAAGVAAALAGERLVAVYSSDLRRASETAGAIAERQGLVVHLEPELREAEFGEWEGLDEPALLARYPEEYRLWRQNSLLHRPPGGESIAELLARVARVYDRAVAAHRGQSLAIVSHGGAVRALVLHAIGAPLDAYANLRMRNASVSLVEIRNGEPYLALYNHVCFLAG